MADIDVYSYTKGGSFTSEVFKIEITNLPDWVGFAQFKKRLISLGLKPVKVKLIDRGKLAFATFRCEEDREEALVKCAGHQWKGLQWKVKKANPAADPLLKKRKQETEEDGEPDKKVAKTEEDYLPAAERLNRAVTPLFEKPYEKQLEVKGEELKTFLKRLVRDIQNNNDDMRSHLQAQKKKYDGLCCELEPMKPSPVLNGYRNKCEFTIGKSPDGKDKTVGFRLGRYNKGIITVLEVTECIHVPDQMKKITKVIQEYLQEESSYPGYDPEKRKGHWRQVMLRSTESGNTMAVLTFHPQELSKDEIDKEGDKVKCYFQTGAGSSCGISSMYFQVQTDRSSDEPREEHLFGDHHIREDLLGMKFRISPAAFFQVNTKAAEVLYTTVGDWCNLGANTVLLDICCGTGTIGLCLAKRVSKVVGVEMCAEAIEDAKVNAKLNGIENAEFHCSKAESFLPNFMRHLRGTECVAVVDPPRSGLHADVVRAIRKCHLVKRVVFIACNPKGALQNIVDFTRRKSKRVQGEEFRVVKAVGVDLFPHTQHCELVMLLERTSASKEATAEAKPEATSTKTDEKEGPSVESEASASTIKAASKEATAEAKPEATSTKTDEKEGPSVESEASASTIKAASKEATAEATSTTIDEKEDPSVESEASASTIKAASKEATAEATSTTIDEKEDPSVESEASASTIKV